MIISRLSQYAIQSLIYMGLQKKGEPILCKEIAEELGVPKAYLSMIMNSLRKAGIVSSNYGRCGGYSLEKDPYQVNLMQILLITEGINFTTQCLMGLKLCGKNGFCPMHEKWMPVKAELISMFEEQNVASLADAVRDGRYHLTDLPRVLYTN